MLMVDAIWQLGVSEATPDRWRKAQADLKSDQPRRLTDLETANDRLRRAICDLTPHQQILSEEGRSQILTDAAGADSGRLSWPSA